MPSHLRIHNDASSVLERSGASSDQDYTFIVRTYSIRHITHNHQVTCQSRLSVDLFCNHSVVGGISWEKERIGVLRDVLGGNAPVVGPVVEASFIFLENVLYVANGAMLGGSGNGGENLFFESGGFAFELCVGNGLVTQVHGQG